MSKYREDHLDRMADLLLQDRGFRVVFSILLVILFISIAGLGIASWLVYKFLTSPCTW